MVENNLLLKTFTYKNDSYQVYFDTLNEKIWVERKVIEHISNKARAYVSRAISHLIIDGVILQTRNIKRISTSTNNKLFLYDKAVIKEIVHARIYNQIDLFERNLIIEYNKEHKKIYLKNGSLYINRYLINNDIDIKLSVIDVSELFNLDISDVLNIMNKKSYDINDLFKLAFIIDNDKANEIKAYLSNILLKSLVDGYYINNDLCINDRAKIINITKIADNILEKNKLNDEEKRKYYKNTISYKNELYESSSFIKKLLFKAKEEVIIISKFMDDDIFNLLNNVCVKIVLYSSTNSLITKYNTILFRKNHNVIVNKKYSENNTYIIVDDDVYYLDTSIINILKQNSFCMKKDIDKKDFLRKLKL